MMTNNANDDVNDDDDDDDKLFRYCLQQSNCMGTELIKNRFDYYRLGFKHCLDDLKQQQIMQTETESSSSYSKFIAHLQKEFDNLTIGKFCFCFYS